MAWAFFDQLRGWRQGVLTGSVLAGVVLLLNITLTIASSTSTSEVPGLADGRKLLFQGNCDQARRLNEYLHWIINVISTVLLSASNYGMQCLSAPTRNEVDRSHAKRQWLDIGVMSFRNIFKISRKRALLWFALGFSSMPLHLFYNSAVYSSVYAVDYIVYQMTGDMLVANGSSTALPPSWVDMLNITQADGEKTVDGGYLTYDLAASKMYALLVANRLTRLTPSDCIAAYSSGTYQTSWGSVILVTANKTDALLSYAYQNELRTSAGRCFDPYGWVCGHNTRLIPWYESSFDACRSLGSCSSKVRTPEFENDQSSNWRPFGNKVDYCLAEPVPQRCTVEFSSQLAAVVIIFNAVKVVVLLYIFLGVKENPLITVGDAIASFLQREDETTRKQCLMSRANGVQTWEQGGNEPRPRLFHATRQRWYQAVSRTRWAICIFLYLTFLSIIISLFYYGLTNQTNANASSLMALGFDTTDPHSFITGWDVKDLISSVFVANAPQPILSSIYYTYNGLFTAFLLGVEWNSYQSQRKGLRVSDRPRAFQRSSYILQLPKRWALPLMALSAMLHWLCSQSIFLVSIVFDSSVFMVDLSSLPGSSGRGSRLDDTFRFHCFSAVGDWDTGRSGTCISELFTCGYSPAAILTTFLLGILMVVGLICVGARQYSNAGMPVAGSCSAAISAACHLSPPIAGEGKDQIASPILNSNSRNVDIEQVSRLHSTKLMGDGKRNAISPSISSYFCRRGTRSSLRGDYIKEELGAAHGAVQWGAVKDPFASVARDQQFRAGGDHTSIGASSPLIQVGHCTFTDGEIDTLMEEGMYA